MGGVIAANCSGPRRRLYGTARDLVIGMKFATLAGQDRAIGRHGGQERGRSRYGQTHDRIVRHAGRHRGGQFQAPADARAGAKFSAGVRISGGRHGRARPPPQERAPARGGRPVESRGRSHHRKSRVAAGRKTPRATRPRSNATSASWRNWAKEWPSMDRATRPSGNMSRSSPRNSWKRAPMARWCAPRVR